MNKGIICDHNSIKEGGVWSCIGAKILYTIEVRLVLVLIEMVILFPREMTKPKKKKSLKNI